MIFPFIGILESFMYWSISGQPDINFLFWLVLKYSSEIVVIAIHTEYLFVYQGLSFALENSTATWKIVVGHHTIRSLGRHGDTKELVDQVLPILDVRSLLSACIFNLSIYITEEGELRKIYGTRWE